MQLSLSRPRILDPDLAVLLTLAGAGLFIHTVTNGQYGFHRDELDTLENARHLDWGYVSYPPFAPFVARVALELFGTSLIGFRFFAAMAAGAAMVLAGLMARELGGSRRAQVLASLAMAITPISMAMGAMFSYVSLDYLWWTAVAYLAIRLVKTENPLYWLGIGLFVGLGMMTKYTMAYWAAALVGGALLTRTRRHLATPWPWAGAGLALLVFLPNLVWQIQHGFVTLDFLSSIHARDVRIGRTEGFLPEQLYSSSNPLLLPLWMAGLAFYLFMPSGRRFRIMGWMYVITLGLMLASQARSYYFAPAYPILFAAGAVVWDRWLGSMSRGRAGLASAATWGAVATGTAVAGALALPIAPVNSDLWRINGEVHGVFIEEIGWPELVEQTARAYFSIPPEERPRTAILAGNYGELGAVNLYGPALGLPKAIGITNGYWYRGYGDPPPETLVVLGAQRPEEFFLACENTGRVTNPYGVMNEETSEYPGIFVCRGPRYPWPEFWRMVKGYG